MSEQTPNLSLPYIMAAQAQKHVTHNEALRALDALVQISVENPSLSIPPSTPLEGTRYIVGPSATDEWAGQEGNIAAFQDGAWEIYVPVAGWIAWSPNDSTLLVFDGTDWNVELGGDSSVSVPDLSDGSVTKIGVNATADDTNRLSVNSAALLFNNIGDDVQAKLNKKIAGDTASFLFQTGFSGRAEIGTMGDDDFHVKVSPDGSTYHEAIVVDKDNGQVSISERLSVGGNDPLVDGITISTSNPGFVIKDVGSSGNTHSGTISWRDGSDVEKVWCGLGSSADTKFTFLTEYSGGMTFATDGGWYPIEFGRAGHTPSIKVHTNSYVGILNSSPTAHLDVWGAVRVGNYTVSTVPVASTMGAGSIIFVLDETGGAVLAFSDGTNWLRSTDRAIVS